MDRVSSDDERVETNDPARDVLNMNLNRRTGNFIIIRAVKVRHPNLVVICH